MEYWLYFISHIENCKPNYHNLKTNVYLFEICVLYVSPTNPSLCVSRWSHYVRAMTPVAAHCGTRRVKPSTSAWGRESSGHLSPGPGSSPSVAVTRLDHSTWTMSSTLRVSVFATVIGSYVIDFLWSNI